METVVRQPGEAQPVMGHFAAVKIASDETDERFCVLETTLAAGGGFTSRLHRHHKYVESWFVTDGTLEFCSGNETLLAPAGSFVLAPPSSPHTFGNSGSEETRIVAFYTPGGMDRFIAELGKLRSTDDPGFKAFATLFDRYDTEPADPNVPADIPVCVTTPDQAERLSVGGGTIAILADSAATGGSFALVDYTAPPGFPGPPPHHHREIVDVFYVLEGELTLEIEGNAIAAQPGTLAAIAPGTVHKFSNPSDRPARFLGFVSPGGFEQYFRDVAAAIGDGPFDPAVAAPLIAKYDYEPA